MPKPRRRLRSFCDITFDTARKFDTPQAPLTHAVPPQSMLSTHAKPTPFEQTLLTQELVAHCELLSHMRPTPPSGEHTLLTQDSIVSQSASPLHGAPAASGVAHTLLLLHTWLIPQSTSVEHEAPLAGVLLTVVANVVLGVGEAGAGVGGLVADVDGATVVDAVVNTVVLLDSVVDVDEAVDVDEVVAGTVVADDVAGVADTVDAAIVDGTDGGAVPGVANGVGDRVGTGVGDGTGAGVGSVSNVGVGFGVGVGATVPAGVGAGPLVMHAPMHWQFEKQ